MIIVMQTKYKIKVALCLHDISVLRLQLQIMQLFFYITTIHVFTCTYSK